MPTPRPDSVDTFAAVLAQIVEEAGRRSRPLAVMPEGQNCPGEAVLCGSARDTCPPKVELAFAPAKAPTPQAAADDAEVAEVRVALIAAGLLQPADA